MYDVRCTLYAKLKVYTHFMQNICGIFVEFIFIEENVHSCTWCINIFLLPYLKHRTSNIVHLSHVVRARTACIE